MVKAFRGATPLPMTSSKLNHEIGHCDEFISSLPSRMKASKEMRS